jgi:hypothetical protein
MRSRQEAKLEELRKAAGEQGRKEKERKYAVRYHKVRRLLPACLWSCCCRFTRNEAHECMHGPDAFEGRL